MISKHDCIGLTGDTEDINVLLTENKLSEASLVFPNVNSIMIPKKALYNLSKYTSKPLLKAVDPKIEVAVEKCLVFLSNLAMTYYTEDKWKKLYSGILHDQSKKGNNNTCIYPKIVDVLTKGTSKGAFIEVNNQYYEGESRKYRLTETYLKAGLTQYTIKDSKLIQRLNSIYYTRLDTAIKNPVCRNLISIYPKLELPTSEELLAIGKKLVKEGRETKRGKLLTMRNKHSNEYWSDYTNRSFVEDNIRLFEFLTSRGFMIPSEGDDKSGHRVVDSFTLMPSWIREQITIGGIKLRERDYTALHPNIAIKLYGGKQSNITHQNVAEKASIDIIDVKQEHLSFFNKTWKGMQKSPLYQHYQQTEPVMLENLRKDKKKNGYKVTSRKMFKIEVDIMTEVIQHLNSVGIQVLYVYDALLCEEKDRQVVTETMNSTILEHGVKTSVKIESPVQGETIQCKQYRLDEEINLYEVLPAMSFTIEESMTIICDFDFSKMQMSELVKYIGKQRKEQQYNDYNGVRITPEHIDALKTIIAT
ncbi:hypothetical protein FUA48_14255 [Flavobacterium alkalisoli]|uniref:Uncharacterized protein n=1 Tax=Flavobacterium alkalisoli TaxID=2602769 RepID=A0A5B9G118_9FLAO|nr:hypothetical protein [Flavobacterium alkalisoli]QEE50697.1 hypothetical protein FUA48_14255 [Flavobacterium alkalisoli]